MAGERSVGVVWSEETDNGVVLHMRMAMISRSLKPLPALGFLLRGFYFAVLLPSLGDEEAR